MSLPMSVSHWHFPFFSSIESLMSFARLQLAMRQSTSRRRPMSSGSSDTRLRMARGITTFKESSSRNRAKRSSPSLARQRQVRPTTSGPVRANMMGRLQHQMKPHLPSENMSRCTTRMPTVTRSKAQSPRSRKSLLASLVNPKYRQDQQPGNCVYSSFWTAAGASK